jgi:hypothetical protein
MKKEGLIDTAGVRALHIPRVDTLAGYSGDF